MLSSKIMIRSSIVILLLASLICSGCSGPKESTEFPDANEAIACDLAGEYSKDDQFLILSPKVIFSGGESAVTMSAFSDQGSVSRCVEYTLVDDQGRKTPLVKASTSDKGNTRASFEVPEVEEGSYTLEAKPVGAGEPFTAAVQVVNNNPIFIETDKPIYKPGQTIHVRILCLNNELVPLVQESKVEIQDAKGIKVFKDELTTNEYGVAFFDLPLASELNYGTWKIKATSGSSSSVVDIRVEEYVLPKFDVQMTTSKEWYLADENITGTVAADYFFGKKVEGTVSISALRYVGTWEEYAHLSAPLKDGSLEFELPAVEYAAGTYGAGGQGSMMLNVSVTDNGNNTEQTTDLLTISSSPVVLQLIPESFSIKPGMPLQVLIVTKDPGGGPIDTKVDVTADIYTNYDTISLNRQISTTNGAYLLTLDIPEGATSLELSAGTKGASTVYSSLNAVYSPSASFVHISQISEGTPAVGDVAQFAVYSTNPETVFYDVFANGRTVYSATSDDPTINIPITPQMSPSARLVAYVINPNNEVSADSLPFDVGFDAQVNFTAAFDQDIVEPGVNVSVEFDANDQSMIGFSIVDESVYALSEGRLNLKQVFDELELRFMDPQVEAHPYWYQEGAYDVIENAGMNIMVSPDIEVPRVYDDMEDDVELMMDGGMVFEMEEEMVDAAAPMQNVRADADTGSSDTLVEVERVRQFFPETWVWIPDLLTDEEGRVSVDLKAPDSITTWKLHAVSSGPEGIGIAQTQLTVFQDFFIDPSLPYSVIRGEEFPVQVQVYNYLDIPQTVHIGIKDADWFKLTGDAETEVEVEANSVSYVSFTISPVEVGVHTIELTGQTTQRADGVKKTLIVEPEGVTREIIDNGVLGEGSLVLDSSIPEGVVDDSGQVMVTFTPSIVAQSINGVDDLLGMPYGCGEQNMMLFSTDVEVLRYLKATQQDDPATFAKALTYIKTGYQRQLTFRHDDGSFSAFGESDEQGSLWLTAFVLSQFSGARDVTTIDESILQDASRWIKYHQQDDGSWESVGFVIHEDMMGGLSGTYALTAFTTLALEEYGNADPGVMAAAQAYLEQGLSSQDDPYTLAITSLVLQRLDSDRADEAMEKLKELAQEDENGVYWGYKEELLPQPYGYGDYEMIMPSSKNVETTAYATLSLVEAGDPLASSSLKWLVAQRNSNGGFSSTQDTVMAFRALINAAILAGKDIDATVSVTADDFLVTSIRITPSNYDVVQIIELPENSSNVTLELSGEGEVNYQLVRRFNVILPPQIEHQEIELEVDYDSTDVGVNDEVTVDVSLKYNGMQGVRGMVESSGMMIVDIAVPTGFSPVSSSLEELKEDDVITRYEIAGRKVILYVDEMEAGEQLLFNLKMKALFPVKAMVQHSSAYSYYNPQVRAEVKGMNVSVT